MTEEPYKPRSAVRIGRNQPFAQPNPGQTPSTQRRSTGILNSARSFDQPQRRSVAGRKRTWLLMALAFPLVLAGFVEIFDGNALGAIRDFGLFALFVAGARMIRDGLAIEAEYEARDFASAPAFPRKILGSALLGIAMFLTTLLGWDAGLLQSIAYGVLGFGASIWSFGLDPTKGKGYTTSTGVTPDMVIEALEEAEEKVVGIERAAREIADRPLRDRLARVTRRSRDILGRIEQDPSDLRRAKKFLKIYLDGALEATRKYARSQNDLGGDTTMYVKFRTLLDDMEKEFDHQYEKLLTNDRIDLDVEIDVLADRLRRESAL